MGSLYIKRKTNEEFILEMKTLNPNIKIIGKYINNKVPINCKCLCCNDTWSPRPDQLIRGQSCPKCGLKKRSRTQSKSHVKFVEELNNMKNEIELAIGSYINNHTKLIFKCNQCDELFPATPNNVLCGSGCPICNGKHLKTQKEFEIEVSKLNPNIMVTGTYINNKTKLEVQCLKCKFTWKTIPTNFLKNSNCIKCEKKYKGEIKIEDYLMKNNIKYTTQKTYDDLRGVNGGKLRYDFYLMEYDFLIEYQGNFHDGSSFVGDFFSDERLKIQQEHDKRKREYAKLHDIKLLEIWHYDYQKIEEILNENLKEKF